MIIIINLIIVAICAFLKFIGEIFNHNFQRFVLPVVLGFGISIVSNVWWLGITILPMIGALCIGYGQNTLLYKYLSDAGARGFWLFFVCFVAGLGPLLFGHEYWYCYVGYFIIGGILGATLRNLNNAITSWICGGWIGVLVFLIH